MKKHRKQTSSANAASMQAIPPSLEGGTSLFPLNFEPRTTCNRASRSRGSQSEPRFWCCTASAQEGELSDQPTQQIRFRQYAANLNTGEKDWTQAFVRVHTPSRPGELIDVYEYYWAPVITDRFSALQSLRFLIGAGLSPFQYLRAIRIDSPLSDAIVRAKFH
jgi:hypothetical protein